jgi:predicted SprT family Zn-dependent metalloprotease
MNLQPVTGKNFTTICAGCNKRMELAREHFFADLDGKPFEAYYCLKCSSELQEVKR